MGNHHSSSLDTHFEPEYKHHHSVTKVAPPRAISRKRSTAKLLGCTSADAFEIHLDVPPPHASLHTHHEHMQDHESTTAASDNDEKRSFDPPPLYAYSTSAVDILEDAAATAYKSFLKEYPDYQLTWILDALRRSDFSRLDRSGETYVDYMGGSLYPESLIRVHTGFLHRNILGNTHSINNSYVIFTVLSSPRRFVRAVICLRPASVGPKGYATTICNTS